MAKRWQLAQMNVGTIKYPQEDPRMDGFMSRLDEINALAEQSQGFVWRLQSDSGNATDIDVGGEPLFIVNMSVWASAEALFEFVYKTMHREVMVQRRQWFEKPEQQYQVLWWVPAGHEPAAQEGLERLERLNSKGATAEAFTFRKQFAYPGDDRKPEGVEPKPYCAGWD